VLLFCIAGQLGVNGTMTVEGRVGQAPFEANGEVRWGVIGAATPDIGLYSLSPRLELRLDYAPRIFWRQPNEDSTLRPLVLHIGMLSLIAKVSRRARLAASANVSEGEADYTLLSQTLIGPTQAAVPSVVEFFSVTSAVAGEYDLSRLSMLSGVVSFVHRRPVGATANVPVVDPRFPPFPTQTTLAVAPALKLVLSREDELTVSTIGSYGTYSGGVDVTTVVPQAVWRRHLSPRYDLRLGAGVAYAHVVPAIDNLYPVAPVGELGLDALLTSRRGASTRASVTARVDYFIDPVLATAGPRALLMFGVYSTLNPRWLVGAEGAYSTVLTKGTVQLGAPVAPDQTAVYLTIPVRYRTGDHVQMEFGFRYADRGPSVEIDAFGFHQRQLWVYYMVTATTRRPTSQKVQ